MSTYAPIVCAKTEFKPIIEVQKKLPAKLLYKKSGRKMLVKLTQGCAKANVASRINCLPHPKKGDFSNLDKAAKAATTKNFGDPLREKERLRE